MTSNSPLRVKTIHGVEIIGREGDQRKARTIEATKHSLIGVSLTEAYIFYKSVR
jgi:hypothetical protein